MPGLIWHPESQWTPASAGVAIFCEAIIFIISLIQLRRVKRLSAANAIASGAARFTGTYRPAQPLSTFTGYPLNGTWVLSITDVFTGDVGALFSWGLTATLSNDKVYTYNWDVFSSGFFGATDDMVFRLEAYPNLKPLTNSLPIYQYSYAAASTFPFRVRGTQLRVLSGTQPISNAMVYRLPTGQTTGALPFSDRSGNAYRTDGLGYLQGRGQIGLGDQLIALYPISSTGTYTLYYSNATPTLTGLNTFTVITSGVQTLTVSPSNPLVLFSLDVSQEWDARQDSQFTSARAVDLGLDWAS